MRDKEWVTQICILYGYEKAPRSVIAPGAFWSAANASI